MITDVYCLFISCLHLVSSDNNDQQVIPPDVDGTRLDVGVGGGDLRYKR